jgi:hypothetical protein
VISSVAVPVNTFGGPETEAVSATVRGLITSSASEESITGAAESSTGSSRGGRNKVQIDAVFYTTEDVVINETDRVTDTDGVKYSVVGVGKSQFGSHQVAFLERIR